MSGITFDDLQGRLATLAANYGFDVEFLNKVAAIGVQRHIEAADRWVRLEADVRGSAPLWLSRQEAHNLAAVVRREKGAEMRLLHEALEDLLS